MFGSNKIMRFTIPDSYSILKTFRKKIYRFLFCEIDTRNRRLVRIFYNNRVFRFYTFFYSIEGLTSIDVKKE